MNTFAAWLVLFYYLGFALRPVRKVWDRLNQTTGSLTLALFLIPYLLATELQPTIEDLLRLAVFITLPTFFLSLHSQRAKPFGLWQLLAILALWVPIEPDLFVLIADLAIPWIDLSAKLPDPTLLPRVEATLLSGVEIPIHTLTSVSLALYLFLIRHPLEHVGFSFSLAWDHMKKALAGLVVYAAVGLPLGLGIGFLKFNPKVPGSLDLLIAIVAGYLFTALIEEFLFRGIIQNLLSQRLQRSWTALVIGAFIFGLAHLNNNTPGFPIPNWAYVLMASLAGLAYGWVWMRTKKVTASAVTHMLVNLVWGIILI